ncbi:nicotinate-nucleotide--dimethylbenzimidazole phosphoribosyltransferase [Celerinatantimonas sp. YJH-8]|uniref:nicotinate-nucleotide--dimethylbenzimidazole phosphoribosyltransferase n=1 Tax=Celerinatantimonas sp. YJH-8 TaxID=3228714 RepID=UPI0038CB727B
MYAITPLSRQLESQIHQIIDQKTKPPGSLGKLEAIACQIALIQQSLTPSLQRPAMLVFAADHGIVAQGVSLFPKQVTVEMVNNFLQGGAGINVFCRQHDIALSIVNVGVDGHFEAHPQLVDCSVTSGTADFSQQRAMTQEQCQQAMDIGAAQVKVQQEQGTNVIGFGEMGIGNTSSAAAIMAALLELSAEECVGRGTGLDAQGVSHKARVIADALALHQLDSQDPRSVLEAVGGLEIAAMTGAMLAAAELNMVVLIDGFIATSAALVAMRLVPAVRDYMIFTHGSAEQGHRKLLQAIGAQPLLDIGFRLGEGTGAAVAYPLICSALVFFNEMASFADAGVSSHD